MSASIFSTLFEKEQGGLVLGRVLNNMPEHVAVLNSSGQIVWTNKAWKRFSVENEGSAGKTDIGANYLGVCERAEKEHVWEAGVLRSRIISMFQDNTSTGSSSFSQLEYPCHSPLEKRWFSVWLIRCEFDGAAYVAVIHQNITTKRVLSERVNELRGRLLEQERRAAFAEWTGFVSHEIKNPLSVIMTRAGLIRHALTLGKFNSQSLIESCRQIEETVDQVISIVNGMLSMFKGSVKEPYERLSVRALLDDALAMTREYVQSVRVEIPDYAQLEEILIECVRIHFLQIITNLVRNAAMALRGTKDPWIRLEVMERDDEIQVRIIDNGPGVPQSLRENFRKGNKSGVIREKKQGAGVGFLISRTLAEMHGGCLYLDENIPQTCFVLSLPKLGDKQRTVSDAA
ncbi:MAG: sensor histidine kinase [Bdellovibrionia bacterium]